MFFYQKSWSEEIGGGLKQFSPLRMSHHINARLLSSFNLYSTKSSYKVVLK